MHSPSYPSRKVLFISPFTEKESAAQRSQVSDPDSHSYQAVELYSVQCNIHPSIHPFTHSINVYDLSHKHVPDTVLGTWNSWVNKTDKIPTFMELAFECHSARACSVTIETKKRVLLSNGGDTSMENLTALWKVQYVLIGVRKGAKRTKGGHQGRLPGGGVT